jgi:hypothetical protein
MSDNEVLNKFIIGPVILIIMVFVAAVVYQAVFEQMSDGQFKRMLVDVRSSFITAVYLLSAVGTVGFLAWVAKQFSEF